MKEAMVSSVEDTARYLGISVDELQAVIDNGRLKIVQPGERPMIHESDLDEFMRESFKVGPKKLITGVPLISFRRRSGEIEETG